MAQFPPPAYPPGGGSSGVTSVTGTAGQIASTGGDTPVLSLINTAVTPATYGDATHVAQVTVDAKGRITAANSVAIVSPVPYHSLGTLATWVAYASGSHMGTYVAGTAAGTAATISVVGCDEGLIVSVTPGAIPSGNVVLSVYYQQTFANVPAVVISGGNDATGALPFAAGGFSAVGFTDHFDIRTTATLAVTPLVFNVVTKGAV